MGELVVLELPTRCYQQSRRRLRGKSVDGNITSQSVYYFDAQRYVFVDTEGGNRGVGMHSRQGCALDYLQLVEFYCTDRQRINCVDGFEHHLFGLAGQSKYKMEADGYADASCSGYGVDDLLPCMAAVNSLQGSVMARLGAEFHYYGQPPVYLDEFA